MNTSDFDRIWIGLAEVYSLNKSGEELLDGFKNGFANILGYADTQQDFEINVFQELRKIDLGLKIIEEVELYLERIENFEVDEELHKIATSINKENQIGFGTFYVYEGEED